MLFGKILFVSNKMIKIILDAMGGDNAPQATVQGGVMALEKDKELYLILTGRQNEIEKELAKYKYDKTRLEIVDCPDVIDMNDIPTEAVKRKESSLIKAFWMLKKQEATDRNFMRESVLFLWKQDVT